MHRKKIFQFRLVACQLIVLLGFAGNTALLSQNNFVRYTTKQLLQKAENSGVASLNVYPESELNYALPLIDSAVALKLTKLASENFISTNITGRPDFLYAFGLQIKNDQLKDHLLKKLNIYDCLCADTVKRNPIEYGNFPGSSVSKAFEYDAALAHALYRQTKATDTLLLNYAIKKVSYWTPFASEYLNTITKPGLHQLSIRKKEFDPCVLASSVNVKLWVDIIHAITDQKTFSFGNERSDFVYKRFVSPGKKDPDEQKDIIRFGRSTVMQLLDSCTDLDELDIGKVPELKEKIEEYAEKERSSIALYTNGKKALLFFYFEQKTIVGFSKQYVASPTTYLLELTSPKTIQSTLFEYRKRFWYLY